MRWEGQSTDEEAERRLPGLASTGAVRTFDAPEAMGVRFHEVEAKSALNRVPGNTLPFNWTVNPYRGCTHACTYCLDGETPVLMGDGRHRPIAALSPGDAIYGTRVEGRYRHYVQTEVLDIWETRKPTYRVTLADGTELLASEDHRFLSDRGWKFVTGAESGRDRRPHLTSNNRLLGVGRFAAGTDHTNDYRHGYLAGMIRGDANLATYRYERAGRSNGGVHRFRLALTDDEALDRTERFLAVSGVPTKRFEYSPATDVHRSLRALRTSSKPLVDRIRSLVAWPSYPEPAWIRGFLAGIFDAEGSCSRGVLRISNTDRELLGWTSDCLSALNLPWVLEDGAPKGRCSTIRVTGGLPARLRFFHETDPAILRKRSIDGTAVKGKATLGVVSVECIGERDLVDITTGTGDFIADGVISHNCFARPTHKYLDLNAREDFEREIVVKVNIPERLRVELRRPSWKGETVALGTNTDPYQWVERRYGLTRGVWEVLIEARNPGSVLTKSPLLLRDLDLFRELHDVAGFQASLSIPTLDEKAWRATEPRTPHPRKRIEAVAELSEAGIPVGVLVAPLMPGVNDDPEQVEEIIRLCAEAGARSVGGLGLHLKGEVRDIFLDWVRAQRPDLLERYEELYAGGAFLPKPERARIEAMMQRGRKGAGVRKGSMEERRLARSRRPVPRPRRRPEPKDQAEPAQQPSLF